MDDLKLNARSECQLDSLIQSVRIFSCDIGMKFGIEKCAVLVIKRGKLAQTEGITLPDDTTIRAMEESEGYKYLQWRSKILGTFLKKALNSARDP